MIKAKDVSVWTFAVMADLVADADVLTATIWYSTLIDS